MAKESGIRLIANNKKAYHDYFIEDTYAPNAHFLLGMPSDWVFYVISWSALG